MYWTLLSATEFVVAREDNSISSQYEHQVPPSQIVSWPFHVTSIVVGERGTCLTELCAWDGAIMGCLYAGVMYIPLKGH